MTSLVTCSPKVSLWSNFFQVAKEAYGLVTHNLFRGGVWHVYASPFFFLHSHPTDLPTYLLADRQTFVRRNRSKTPCPLMSSLAFLFRQFSSRNSDTWITPLSCVKLHIFLPKRFLGIHQEPHILRPSHSLRESHVRLSTVFYISLSSIMGVAHTK